MSLFFYKRTLYFQSSFHREGIGTVGFSYPWGYQLPVGTHAFSSLVSCPGLLAESSRVKCRHTFQVTSACTQAFTVSSLGPDVLPYLSKFSFSWPSSSHSRQAPLGGLVHMDRNAGDHRSQNLKHRRRTQKEPGTAPSPSCCTQAGVGAEYEHKRRA